MDFLTSLVSPVSSLGAFGYAVAFLIALAESLPFVGLVLPGTIFILLAGFFSSQGYLDIRILILWVTFGAMVGDWVGYRLGTRGTELFRSGRKILRMSHLEKGKRFFARHDGRGILFGRFIGPLRPIMPFVAGLSGMRPIRFLTWAAVSAVFWAWSHLTLGYLFGGIAGLFETWFTRTSVFLFILLALMAALWYVAGHARRFLRLSRSVFRSVSRAIRENPDMRRFLGRHPVSVAFLKRRFDRRRLSGLPLTLILVAFAYVFFLFSGIAEGVLTAEPILLVDERVANLMYAFRDTGFVRFFLWVTLLGRRDVVLFVATAVVATSYIRNRRAFIVPFLVTFVGSQLFASLGKRLAQRPRPDIAYYLEPSFSFPSGHATIAVALYGFIAYVLLRTAAKRFRYRTLVIFSSLVVAIAVGLSRLYLGVHFLSDVWGGFLLGTLWLLIGISLAELRIRRRSFPETSVFRSPFPAKAAFLTILAVPVVWYVSVGLSYDPLRSAVDRSVPAAVGDDALATFSALDLPRYSETFSGAHQEPMSFIVVAPDETTFVAVMESSGWLLSDPVTVPNMLRLAEESIVGGSYDRAPMTPSFWNTRVHDLGFQKETEEGNVHARHHARFWKTPVRTGSGETVYVGTASLDIGIKWLVTHRIDPDIDTERETILSDIVGTGRADILSKTEFVDPVLGKNFSGDPFFTDGEAYVLRVR